MHRVPEEVIDVITDPTPESTFLLVTTATKRSSSVDASLPFQLSLKNGFDHFNCAITFFGFSVFQFTGYKLGQRTKINEMLWT